MAGKPKRTARMIFAVIFIVIGMVFGAVGGGLFYYRQSVASQKSEVEKDETVFIVHVDSEYMEREEFFEYADNEIKEATYMAFIPSGVALIFILLAVNNISKNKKEKRAEQTTA